MGRHSGPSEDAVRLSARVYGVVQGVGFRFRTQGRAEELGLTGTVENLDDGSVAVLAEGPEEQVSGLLDWLRSSEAPGRVERVEQAFTAAEGTFQGFSAR